MTIISKATAIPALWLLSFLGSFFLLPVSDAIQTAAVVTMLVSLLGYVVCTGTYKFAYTKLTVLIGLLWGLAAISVVCSEVPFISLTYFFFFSAFPLTFLLFSFTSAEHVSRVIHYIILTIGIGAIIQFYFMPQMLKANGTYWPLADNNSLAVILATGALLFIGEGLKAAKFARYHIVAAVILFAGVMTTGGVAVFLGFLLVLAVFTWLVKPASYKPVLWFVAGVLLLMIAMPRSDMSVYHFLGTWSSTLDIFLNKGLIEPNAVSGSRLIMWESACEIFKRHIVTGTGIGTFFLYYPEFRSLSDDSAGYMAHNDFIQIAAEMGVFAPLLALMIIGFLIYGLVKTIKQTEDRISLLLPFSAFGLMIGHSLVNFNLYVLPTLMLMGFFLADWNKHVSHKEIAIGGTKTMRECVSFIIVMIVLVPLWGCYLSEYYTSKTSDDLVKGNIQQFSDHLNLADRWSTGQNARAVLQAARFAAATEHPERALELLSRAEQINPRMVQVSVERARIYSATHPAKGLVEIQKALLMDKGSLSVRMTMADILDQLNRHDEAYAVLKEGLVAAPRTQSPIVFYKILAAKSLEHGDLDLNQDMLARIKRIQYPEY